MKLPISLKLSKKITLLAIAVFVFVGSAAFLPISQRAHAVDTSNFVISNFEADYYLAKDASGAAQLKTVEKITADFPAYDQNHGIIRAIPKKYLSNKLHAKLLSVTDATGMPLSYTTATENDNLTVKIGNANTYVHGKQTYVITYSQDNVIRFFDDHDELYWNINGTQGPEPVTKLTARVHLMTKLADSLKSDKLCYVGSYGQKGTDCKVSMTQANDQAIVTMETTKPLAANQTATIVLGFNKGTFEPLRMGFWEKNGEKILLIGALSGTFGAPLITFIILFNKWRKFGRDPRGKGTIIPEYQAPKDLSVLASSVVYSESLSTNAFSAQIVDLAIKGYIRIEEQQEKHLLGKSNKYMLCLLKPADDQLSDDLKLMLDGIFTGKKVGDKIAMEDLSRKFYKKVTEITDMLMQSMTDRGYFVKNPQKVRTTCVVAGIILLIIGIFTAIFIVGVGLIISAVLCFIFSAIMPARTKQGLTAKEYLEGLKLYIGTAEKARFEYLQSVKGAERVPIKENNNAQKVKLFEQLLPYAMLFKMEKSWAKQFENVYAQPPDWYNGNWSTFSAVYLASSLGSFNSASTSSFASPTSSSSSGFGGGGFAGGGGGGGGVGGW